ncbi:Dps family protein [Camelimonas sp. ID_303_24]
MARTATPRGAATKPGSTVARSGSDAPGKAAAKPAAAAAKPPAATVKKPAAAAKMPAASAKAASLPTRDAGSNRLDTPSDFAPEAVLAISDALKVALADTFALYLKTKNFHWHMSGSHFRDYHLMLDEQSEQIYASTDELAERARKIGGTSLRSIGHIARLSTIQDNDAEYVAPEDMLRELVNDNKTLIRSLRKAHAVASDHDDCATTSVLENFIDTAERRTWFLFEAARTPDRDGR